MSYDLEIGSHEKPERELIERWAGEQGLTVDRDLSISRGDGHLMTIDGPTPAAPEDFAEDLAAACLAPRWMLTLQVPHAAPKREIALARQLARTLAEDSDGAAYDPQAEKLLWPRSAKRKRVPPRPRGEDTTSRVALQWFLPPDRWPDAPATLLELIRRRAPEALPTRYGQWEPPPHKFRDPAELTRFMHEHADGFWYASCPSFGGHWRAPDDDACIARLEVDFDARVLEQNPRWREAVVELFVTASSRLGAFFAAAQVEPGWIVRASNRLYASSKTKTGEHIPLGNRWQGLPPTPMWLSWFGAPYKDLVTVAKTPKRSLLRRPPRPRVEHRGDGLFVRLGDTPRPARALGSTSLPPDLTYRPRKRGERALPGDAARVIPPL